MKVLQNQSLTILAEDLPENPNYGTLIRILMKPVAGQSYDLNDIESRLRVGKVLDAIKSNEDIQLEDSDAKYLQNLVKGYRWGIIHQDILDFSNAIANLK